MNQAEATASARIALVSFDSLGDGLIYLMIAANLQKNGFDLTLYGNIAYQMREWLPSLKIRPYPPKEQMEAELAAYDLAIVSPPSFIRTEMDEATTARLREKWLLICQKAPQSWYFDHRSQGSGIRDQGSGVRDSLGPEKFHQLQQLLDSSGSIRFREFGDESVVAMTLEYLREKMQLENVCKQPPVIAPEGLQYRRMEKRIVVSPDSAGPEKKNWHPAAFLNVCHRLQALGFTPEIVVAPNNHSFWEKMAGGKFATPRFDDIAKLAAYLYESGVVVANDSGNGHLASFLGIPVVTIYRKKNPLFHWRPDWKPGIVICPPFSLPGWSASLWKYLIRPATVVAAVERLQRSPD